MAGDIGVWLEGLGLGHYAEAFVENGVDFALLPELTNDDLKDLGVGRLADRKQILREIGGEGQSQPAAPDSAETARPSEAERRQLTVMFCDLVGSTALSEQLDPEDLRGVIGAFQETCTAVIANFEGYIARYMGDGLLVYFGYPQAHEDDAERAVRAGLGIVEAVGDMTTRQNEALEVRVGIATGLVVVGDIIGEGASQERAVLGETPNLAARLQGIAEPNQVVIADSTQRLTAGLFDCQALPAQKLKGISEPVRAYQVRAASDVSSRFEASAVRGLTSLVGRDEEIGLLLKRWQQAQEGEGQVVLLSGEAGVGKSRILQGFQARLEGELTNRVLYYGSPYHRNSALYPAIEQLQRVLRFTKDDDPAGKHDKLEAVLSGLDLASDELDFVLAALLSLPTEGRYPPLDLTPQQLRAKTLDALVTVIAAMAEQHPVLMVIEDVHWIDPSTLELVDQLIERTRSVRMLLVITFRPEFSPPWSGAHVTAYTLNNLGRRDCLALISETTEGKDLPGEVTEQIVAQTDGVPLFVEELTKTVLESGLLEDKGDRYVLSGPLPPFAIPASLQDSLTARLDRLAPVKELAQLAATLGRNFTFELLAAVSPLVDDELDGALSQLVAAGMMYRRGVAPVATYEFKHALVRDAAYESLLMSTRLLYHKRIAQTLRDRFPETGENQPELLAHHFTESGLAEQAFGYWQRAGEHAIERSANIEAIAHLEKGLDLLTSLAPSPQRQRDELAIQIALGVARIATKGFGDSEVERAYARAGELAGQLGETSHLFTAKWDLWIFNQTLMHYQSAQDISDELLELAQRREDPGHLLQAHHAAWTTRFFRGELQSTVEHIDQGRRIYDRRQHGDHAYVYGGHDPGVCCHAIGAWALWLLGHPDRARDATVEARRIANDLSHPFSQAQAHAWASAVYQLRRDVASTLERAAEATALSDEHGFAKSLWTMTAAATRGWALVRQGDVKEGVATIRRGLEIWKAGLLRSYFLTLLAEAENEAGRFDEALAVLREAREMTEKSEERWWQPEVLRLTGEILLRRSPDEVSGAADQFDRALAVARQTGARSLELRAATSLARLWRGEGREAEARDLLTPVFGWFTEGFDTPDLKDAKALLAELS